MIKCSDLFNLIAPLWHFDEKQLVTSLFPVIAVPNSDQAPQLENHKLGWRREWSPDKSEEDKCWSFLQRPLDSNWGMFMERLE